MTVGSFFVAESVTLVLTKDEATDNGSMLTGDR